MSNYASVIETIARNARTAVELGNLAHADAIDLAAQTSVDTAAVARARTGVYAQETTTEMIDDVLFHAAVARDVLNGDVARPSVGNVRQAALDALTRLVG